MHQPPARDYRLAITLGTSKTTISNYSSQHSFPSAEICQRIAQLLNVPFEHVLVMVASDRAQTEDERAAWDRVARKIGAI